MNDVSFVVKCKKSVFKIHTSKRPFFRSSDPQTVLFSLFQQTPYKKKIKYLTYTCNLEYPKSRGTYLPIVLVMYEDLYCLNIDSYNILITSSPFAEFWVAEPEPSFDFAAVAEWLVG